MEPIDQYARPAPRDNLDQDTASEETVDALLYGRHEDRNTDAPSGVAGEITNIEVQHAETALDHAETDPFHESTGGEDAAELPQNER